MDHLRHRHGSGAACDLRLRRARSGDLPSRHRHRRPEPARVSLGRFREEERAGLYEARRHALLADRCRARRARQRATGALRVPTGPGPRRPYALRPRRAGSARNEQHVHLPRERRGLGRWPIRPGWRTARAARARRRRGASGCSRAARSARRGSPAASAGGGFSCRSGRRQRGHRLRGPPGAGEARWLDPLAHVPAAGGHGARGVVGGDRWGVPLPRRIGRSAARVPLAAQLHAGPALRADQLAGPFRR